MWGGNPRMVSSRYYGMAYCLTGGYDDVLRNVQGLPQTFKSGGGAFWMEVSASCCTGILAANMSNKGSSLYPRWKAFLRETAV